MDSDSSHYIKRHLLLGRKAMTNLDSILKSRDIILPTKVHIVKAIVFPIGMYSTRSQFLGIQFFHRLEGGNGFGFACPLMFFCATWFLIGHRPVLVRGLGVEVPCFMPWSGSIQFSSVQFSHSVMSDSLQPHESQHATPPCPSPSPGVHSDSLPSSP